MKSMFVLLFLVGCSTQKIIEPVVSQPPKVVVDYEAEIKKIITQSDCAKYNFKNRGRAPQNYLEFIASTYRKEFCKNKPEIPLGPIDKDALAFYGLTPTLKSSYTLTIGLGMRESTGKACTGKDASATNTSAETAEAGPFQFSANSLNADKRLREIYDAYLGKCEVTPCTNPYQAKNWGTGNGVYFQKLAKECPAFATEYASFLIRVLRRHFGPINRKEVEVVNACGEMLDKVSALGCE